MVESDRTSDLAWSCGIQLLKFMPNAPVTPDTVAKHSIAQLTTRFSDTISLRLRSSSSRGCHVLCRGPTSFDPHPTLDPAQTQPHPCTEVLTPARTTAGRRYFSTVSLGMHNMRCLYR